MRKNPGLYGVRARRLALWTVVLLLAGCFQPAGRDLEPTTVDLSDLTAMAPPPTMTPTEIVEPPPAPIDPTPEPPAVFVPPTESPTPTPPIGPETLITPTAFEMFAAGSPAETPIPPDAAPLEASPEPPSNLLPTPTALPTDNPCVHTVQPGEWLYSIARTRGINPVDLIAANPWAANRILQPGDVINIPNCQPAAAPTSPPPPEPPTPTPSGTPPTPIPLIGRIYTVVEGDTLGSIARKFDTTVQAVMNANGLTSTFLRIGQQLRIPAPE